MVFTMPHIGNGGPTLALLAVLTLGVLQTASAQEPADATPTPTDRTSIGLPLPRIGLPHPPTGLPPATSPTERAGPGARPAPPRRPEHRGRGGVVYVLPMFVPAPADTASAPPPATSRQPEAPGLLTVSVEPRVGQQIYLDGYYVASQEAGATGEAQFEVEPGTHTLVVTADGFEPLQAPVRVGAGRPLTYRGTLVPTTNASPRDRSAAALDAAAKPAAAAPEGPARATTFYIIPGCYLGNVPPADVSLPETCDRRQTVEVHR